MMILFAVSLPVLLLLCGLCVDIGLIELQQQRMQNAADAAAQGAVMSIEGYYSGSSTPLLNSAATSDAALNGLVNGSNGVTVNAFNGPNYGSYITRNDAVQVTITQAVNTIFMGALNSGVVNLTANATALVPPCAYLLGENNAQSYTMEVLWHGQINATGSCGIAVTGGTEMQADDFTSSDHFTNLTGSASASSVGSTTHPAFSYNVPTFTDPLAAMSSPTLSGGCDHTSYSLSSGTVTLSPGNYCKGLNLTNSTVTLNPGLYVITGGGTWSGSTVSGSGVTLFFTSGGGTSYGQFQITGDSNVTISAPTDSSRGGIPAILVFADRNWVTTAAQDFILYDSNIDGDGIWYLPGAGISLATNGGGESYQQWTAPDYLGLVADNLYIYRAEFSPENNYSPVLTGNPFKTQGLLAQ